MKHVLHDLVGFAVCCFIAVVFCRGMDAALDCTICQTSAFRQPACISQEPNLYDALNCTVHIKAGNTEGSGAFISADGIVMTARHVIERADPNSIVVTLRNGLTYHATAVYTPPEGGALAGPDVGFLKVDYYHPTRYLGFRPDRPALGDVVWCLGHPYGGDACPWSVSRGIVASTDRDCRGAFGPGTSYQIDAASFPGNSGGPVIDSYGRIVGLLIGSFNGRESLSVCVPAEDILPWVVVFRTLLGARP